MRSLWHRLQHAPLRLRWPVKSVVFAGVVLLVLYPRPQLFVRHVQRLGRLNDLPEAGHPGVAALAERFEDRLAATGDPDDAHTVLAAVDVFVREQIRYAWDWDTWGVADYVPTVDELLAMGREDCDGRAVLAASLLRRRGIDARLVGDVRHVWVATPFGETMGPLGPASFVTDEHGLHLDWRRLLDPAPPAVAVWLFPFHRELIIVLALWVLWLPPAGGWKRASAGLVLLVAGLIVVRLAGMDPLAPSRLAAVAGLMHAPLAAVVLSRRPGEFTKRTDRSVSFA